MKKCLGDQLVCAVFALLRERTPIVTIGPSLRATNVGESALTTGVQRNNILAGVVDVLNNVNLSDGIFVEVVCPAEYRKSAILRFGSGRDKSV